MKKLFVIILLFMCSCTGSYYISDPGYRYYERPVIYRTYQTYPKTVIIKKNKPHKTKKRNRHVKVKINKKTK